MRKTSLERAADFIVRHRVNIIKGLALAATLVDALAQHQSNTCRPEKRLIRKRKP